jgi:hypothetical protein
MPPPDGALSKKESTHEALVRESAGKAAGGAYVAARARAIAALPHDELSCSTTNWSVVAGSGLGPVQHRALQSSNTKRQAQRAINAVPPEQFERSNA